MTKEQRKKLAKAARELASEYAEGRGPTLRGNDYCACALGQMFRRARIDNKYGEAAMLLEDEIEEQTMGIGRLLSDATYQRGANPGAVVFPLLWLADELESAP